MNHYRLVHRPANYNGFFFACTNYFIVFLTVIKQLLTAKLKLKKKLSYISLSTSKVQKYEKLLDTTNLMLIHKSSIPFHYPNSESSSKEAKRRKNGQFSPVSVLEEFRKERRRRKEKYTQEYGSRFVTS